MVHCFFIGPFKDKALGRMAEDYRERLERLWPISVRTLPEDPKKIAGVLEEKKGKGLLLSLDAHGEAMDSNLFAKWVTGSSRDLFFFAWGAEGPAGGKAPPGMRSISLSPMTYPHELARVLLLEQLYRSGAWLKGHPYPRQ